MSSSFTPRYLQLDDKHSSFSKYIAREEELHEPTSKNTRGYIGKERETTTLRCLQCEISFSKRGEFETHLLSHVRVPIILANRLSDLYIARAIASSESVKKKKEAKTSVARKHTHKSYVIQKDVVYEPLKLTLKLADKSKQVIPSYETAPKKVLIGPGDCAVKKENTEQEGGSVEGLAYNKDRVENEGKTSGPEEALCDQGSDSGSGEEDGRAMLPGASKETLETLETLRRLGVVRLPGPRKRSSSMVSAAQPSAPPSPTPSEMLGPEFLAPERPSCPPTPVMMEKSAVDDERSRSPASHSKDSSHSSDENSDADDQQEADPASPSSKQKHDEDSNGSNYSWNEGTSYDEGVGSEVTADSDEKDPLFLPEPSSGDNEDANNDENSASDYESLTTRGDDSQSEKESKPKNLPSAESLGLSAEYISLERLGDSSNNCSVCNEKFPDRPSLSKHKAQAGHFKCGHGGCGIVCGSTDELNVHQEMAHGQGAPDVKPTPGKHPLGTTHQVPQIHPKPLSNLVQQPVSPRAPCPSSLPIQQVGVQKRAAPANGDMSSSNKQRRLDVLLPDKHDDADCHVIALQKRSESGPVIGNVEGLVNSPDSTIHLSDSITLSVRQPPSNTPSATPAASGKGKSDPKAVANILATRGITVVPSGGGTNRVQPSPQKQLAPQPQRPAAVQQSPTTTASVAALNLNSAISIIPAASSPQQPTARQQAPSSPGGFAVPQGRGPMSRQQQQQQVVDRPPRPPTVDLTQDTPIPTRRPMQQPPAPQFMSRGRARGRPVMSRHTCQICSKVFSTPENLTAHMALHRSPGKLPFRCNNCPAQYPTQHGLLIHQQACRREPPRQQGNMMPQIVEMAVPLINMKIPGLMNRLRSLGVTNYISYSQFINMPGNHVGLPIVTVDGSRLPALNNITQIGATAVISFGPIKPLPR